jgi:hypothetical protein
MEEAEDIIQELEDALRKYGKGEALIYFIDVREIVVRLRELSSEDTLKALREVNEHPQGHRVISAFLQLIDRFDDPWTEAIFSDDVIGELHN